MQAGEIKRLRERKGWSQWKLAQWLGVHPDTVRSWESGRRSPNPENEVELSILALFQTATTDTLSTETTPTDG